MKLNGLTDRLLALLNKDAARIKDQEARRDFLGQRARAENYWTFEHVRDGAVIGVYQFENLATTVGLNALLDNTFSAAAGSTAWYVGLVGAGAGTVAINSAAAAVTGTSTTFTSALAASPIADIIIVGAGAAGADLTQTVATYTSATSITLSGNASTTVTGASYACETVAADTLASHGTFWTETAPYSNGTRPAWTKNGSASGGANSNSSSKASFSVNASGRVFGGFMASDSTKSGTTGTLYGMGLFTSSGSRSVISGDTLNVQVDLTVTAS